MRAEISEIITIRTKSEERARKIADDVKATVRQTSGEGASLSIKITGRDRRTRSLSFDYVATLPEIFSVQARTRSGDITVENLQGEIDISTSGGDLELTHLSGKIFGKTSGGDIDCEDLGGRIVVVTSGGFIDMAEISGELNATTSGGDISVENTQGAVLVSTSGGDIDLADLVGREISATTSGGDITATDLTANTTIDLHTSGGNVENGTDRRRHRSVNLRRRHRYEGDKRRREGLDVRRIGKGRANTGSARCQNIRRRYYCEKGVGA